MVAVSAASVYYATVQWELPNLLINGWQVFLGGVFLLPVTLLFARFFSHGLGRYILVSGALAEPGRIHSWLDLLVLSASA